MRELATGAQRGAFDEWVDMMREWHRELDVTPDPAVTLTTKFADSVPDEIGFGRYAGEERQSGVRVVAKVHGFTSKEMKSALQDPYR